MQKWLGLQLVCLGMKGKLFESNQKRRENETLKFALSEQQWAKAIEKESERKDA